MPISHRSALTVKSQAGIISIANPVEAIIVTRLNRFVVEVEVWGKRYRASINNTGRLHEFLVTGRHGFCLRREKPLKTDFRLFAIKERNLGAIIDTQLQMAAFERALESGLIPWLEGCRMLRRNAPLANSLIDYLLERNGEKIYLEVKSAALRGGDYAMYPDCPSARGRKHISELTNHRQDGGRAIILFVAALSGVSAFKPNRPADPELYQLLVEAHQAGIEIRALNIVYQPQGSFISLLDADLPVELW